MYEPLRLAYQAWLLDAVYYNLPTYRDFDAFAVAYERLASGGLEAYDANIEAAEVQEQKCGFQDAQGSLKWLVRRLKERLRSK